MNWSRSRLVALTAVLVGLLASLWRFGGFAGTAAVVGQAFGGPRVGGSPPMPAPVLRRDVPEVRVEEVAANLAIPWAIAFAADGRLFFTERPGRIQVIPRGGGKPRPYLDLRAVVAEGEGGLMGLALHPEFPASPYLYAMYTARAPAGAVNRVVRLRDRGPSAGDETILLDRIAAAQNHDGGAVAFGPDGMLYVGTGDGQRPPSAQDPASFNGKILRLTPDGKVPADNPFPGSPVWAYGFRNVTALAWHPATGDLWAASHGPSGEFPGLFFRDSVYVVRRGGNHGWPLVVGTTTDPRLVSPVLYYPDAAVPPGGAIFYTERLFPQFRNNYFLASLRAADLQRVVVGAGNRIERIERWWPGRYGRLRAIAQGPDGAIYFSTSNQDGREPQVNDPGGDHLYRIVPAG
jgi:quinoprotein glucose dehydrogenase